MSNSDLSSSLDAAMALADFGSQMVILGVALEAIDLIVKCGESESFCNWFGSPDRFEEFNLKRLKSFSKFFHHWTLLIEIASFALVVVGLSIEVRGSHEAYRISDRQNSVLNKEAADAWKNAAAAIVLSQQIGTTNAQLVASNLALQKQIEQTTNKVASLEPRRLSNLKIFELSNFLRVREHVERSYVNIVYPEGDSEAQKFSEDIFRALGDARMNVAPPKPERFFSSVQGLFIGTNPFKAPPLATNLISGFALVGINATITYPFENPSSATNFDIIVGSQEHSFLSGQYSEMYFNWRGEIITDWGAGTAKFIKTNGIHIFPDENKTHLTLEFNRSFEVPPLVRYIMPPFGEAIGERGEGLSWDFDLPVPSSITEQTNCWYDLRIAF